MSLSIVILAAGKGKRMHSALPKTLHRLAGKPLLEHVINAAGGLAHRALYVVYGHGGERLREYFANTPAGPEGRPESISHEMVWPEIIWVKQAQQLGTGHAVAQAIERIPVSDDVLILYGDIPLISRASLQRLVAAINDSGVALLTARLADASGYGRIVRTADGEVSRIVEEQDASDEQRSISEVNTGLIAIKSKWLRRWLKALDNDNAQQEYYLTDIIATAVAEKIVITTVDAANEHEITGVNDRIQLAALERHYQQGQAAVLMRQGVTLRDPARFDCRGRLTAGTDVVIDINAVFIGTVILGSNVSIGPGCQLSDCMIGDNVTIGANTIIEGTVIGDGCELGPFARIRPATELAAGVRVGNFVEIKKSNIKSGSKINHLAYVGDSELGEHVNIGAGAITCNYDGVNKHRTVIGKQVFVGSNAALIAPLTIGDNATIAAGATVTRDVPADSLAMNRLQGKLIADWRRGKKRS